MRNDNEKRKGLPGVNALVYLIGGILIGGLGVLVVMFILTKPSCACSPAPTPTFTVPYIPTPNPGATGTAPAAQAAEEQTRLYNFVVNESKGQIGRIYGQLGENTTIEVRAWSNEGIGDVVKAAPYSSTSAVHSLAFILISPL